MAAIEGYASVTSAAPGDVVDFHVRADASHRHFTLDLYRRGRTDEQVATVEGDAFVPGVQDDAALAAAGCGWPASPGCRTVVPAQWRSGYYVAKLSANDATAWVPFVVRAATPGRDSKILLKLSDTTSQAYNGWGGRSFYTTPHAPNISFDRPHDDLALFERYQLPLLAWAETRGIALEYCSSLDLHRDPRFLAPYRLLVSLGHDEYWSLEMRDQVEAFIAAGGNVAFLSANTCYWQARLDLGDSRRIMTCYKETEGKPPDPERADPRRVTVRWYEPPVSRPENRMTGVSYRNGAGWWIDPIVPELRYRGYTVTHAGHGMYAATGLADGDTFGDGTSVDDSILGYETDAAVLVDGSDPPVVAGTDGTPPGFIVLATADLSDWRPHGQGGTATMGVYRRNGLVFTAGTVNWAGGLGSGGDAGAVDHITENVLHEMSHARAAEVPIANAGFETWTSDLPAGWIPDGAGTVSPEDTDPDVAQNQLRFVDAGERSLRVDASTGETWISTSTPPLDGAKSYSAGCWMRASATGATIRLQTTDTWDDFASASHSGSDEWEYVWAAGSPNRDQPDIPCRVKIQVASGASALCDNVTVVEIA